MKINVISLNVDREKGVVCTGYASAYIPERDDLAKQKDGMIV